MAKLWDALVKGSKAGGKMLLGAGKSGVSAGVAGGLQGLIQGNIAGGKFSGLGSQLGPSMLTSGAVENVARSRQGTANAVMEHQAREGYFDRESRYNLALADIISREKMFDKELAYKVAAQAMADRGSMQHLDRMYNESMGTSYRRTRGIGGRIFDTLFGEDINYKSPLDRIIDFQQSPSMYRGPTGRR